VSAYDPDLHEQQRKLKAIEARLARHERIAYIALLLAALLLSVVLFALGAGHLWDDR